MHKTTIALVFGLAGLAAGSLLSNASSAASPNYGEDRGRSARFHIGNDNPQRANTIGGFGHYEDGMVKVKGQWFFTKRTIFTEGSARWQYKGDRTPAW
jgi:hypothetical protein